MNLYRRILKFASPHQKYIYASLFFNILYSVFQIASLGTILPVLGMLFGSVKMDANIGKPVYDGDITNFFDYVKEYSYYFIQSEVNERGALTVLAWLCVITAFTFLLRNIFRYFGAYLLIFYRVGVTKDLRSAMYNKVLALPVSFFMMSRMSNDVGEVENNILGSLVDLINSPFMLISTLVTLFYLSPQLTLFSLIVLPIMGTMISLIGKSLKKDSHEAQHELGNIFSIVDETLKSSKIIKIFNAEKLLSNRFTNSMSKWINNSVSLGRKKELASPMSEFLGAVTFLIITWYGGKEIIVNHSIRPEDFLVFLGIFFQILPPIKSLSSSISNVQKAEASLVRVMEILDADVRVDEIANPVPIHDLKSEITTIANLLTRFYDVTEGSIEIDGENIKNLNLKDYRSLLGMVTQESVLFNDTVYNNIAMGKENATREEIIEASKIANAHQFIESLPEGYDTNIGDDGNKLSGGQKQRVSIARAVLKNPPIMILDEATSALDTESERYVQDALEKMMENRTSLIIAHRLSTIQKADHIVVMEKGDIIEQGSHQDLMDKNGTYRKLVELQNFD